MIGKISVVIPAKNEAPTVGQVVSAISDTNTIDEIIVVDNASSDGTGEIAAAAGARVVPEPVAGLGRAIRAGFSAAEHRWIMKLDADLETFDPMLVNNLAESCGPGVGMIKGIWVDPLDNMPMTRLLILPALRLMFPELSYLRAPNSGLYLFDRQLVDIEELAHNNAADIDVMLRVFLSGYEIREIEIGEINHDSRTKQHYNHMAENILGVMMRHHQYRIEGLWTSRENGNDTAMNEQLVANF
jgi:glucosyl-3-phosphoglycerate synthase